MNISIQPQPLKGKIGAIPSKSAAHRLLICAALADRETRIYCPALSKDIEATVQCLNALGANITYSKGLFTVWPIESVKENARLDCGESGSTLRFLLPVVCALGGGASIKMHGRLPKRPLSPLWEELEAHGAMLSRPTEDTISVGGGLSVGAYRIRADISSQYISGLLFALPILDGKSSLELEGNIESAGYIEMTRQAQAAFGLDIPFDGARFEIASAACYKSPGDAEVEGDWSNAAFWLAAKLLSGGGLEVCGLRQDSLQGDKAVVELIENISKGKAVVDVKNVPDLVPVLSVVAAVSPGKTEFVNGARLRIKESDRIASTCRMLRALGAECEEKPEGLVVHGGKLLGGTVDGENDHRIVMSAAVAAIACEKPVTIIGAQAADKSYPAFFEDYKKLGGKIL
ncbi:MAG: 3-phosphoshikimate 1-carboxyvinyltransferase [Oscillospiraceae bacterium]|nr:3-phosphoshikimate 1-carboxyvinyltransferase [Oscillospiraceae bacterium]